MKKDSGMIAIYLWLLISFVAVFAGFMPLRYWGVRDIIWAVAFYIISVLAAKEIKT